MTCLSDIVCLTMLYFWLSCSRFRQQVLDQNFWTSSPCQHTCTSCIACKMCHSPKLMFVTKPATRSHFPFHNYSLSLINFNGPDQCKWLFDTHVLITYTEQAKSRTQKTERHKKLESKYMYHTCILETFLCLKNFVGIGDYNINKSKILCTQKESTQNFFLHG